MRDLAPMLGSKLADHFLPGAGAIAERIIARMLTPSEYAVKNLREEPSIQTISNKDSYVTPYVLRSNIETRTAGSDYVSADTMQNDTLDEPDLDTVSPFGLASLVAPQACTYRVPTQEAVETAICNDQISVALNSSAVLGSGVAIIMNADNPGSTTSGSSSSSNFWINGVSGYLPSDGTVAATGFAYAGPLSTGASAARLTAIHAKLEPVLSGNNNSGSITLSVIDEDAQYAVAFGATNAFLTT
jgi:hypothetical protein